MHTNVRLWIKATCGPSAKLTDLLMSNRVSSMMLMVKLESWGTRINQETHGLLVYTVHI